VVNDTLISTVLCSDDGVLILDSEIDLQRAVCTLHNSRKQFVMKISSPESKVMAFKGQVPIRSRIVINNTVLE
jgi:hypothetical protein